MRKRSLLALLCILFISGGFAQTYHENDKAVLRAFLSQASGDRDELNATVLGLSAADIVNMANPGDESWVSDVIQLTWNEETPKRLTGIKWIDKKIAGSLNVSSCIKLQKLVCEYSTKITAVDVTGCPDLTELRLGLIPLSTIDVTKNVKLESLSIGPSSMTQLDLSTCTKLKMLDCSGLKISSLDLSYCPLMESLWCGSNPSLKTLNISMCTQLQTLNCSETPLTQIDLSNCPDLIALFCRITKVQDLDLSKCSNLSVLCCNSSLMKTLDVTPCTELTKLECWNNDLTEIDLTKCTKLRELNCAGMALTNLNVSMCPLLESLSCDYNKLTSLDISKCPDLERVSCMYNQMLFAGLPPIEENYGVFYYYSPQEAIIGEKIAVGETLDLSAQYKIKGNTTFYNWFTEEDDDNIRLIAGTDYEITGNGKFVFSETMSGKTVWCNMTNPSFPDLDEESPLVYEVEIKNSGLSIHSPDARSSSLVIYPNPVLDELRIKNEGLNIKSVSVTDIQGRAIYQTNNVQAEELIISASEWASGMYLIHIKNAKQPTSKTLKIIKR